MGKKKKEVIEKDILKYKDFIYKMALGFIDEVYEKKIMEALKKDGQGEFLVSEIIKREPQILLKFWQKNKSRLDDKELDDNVLSLLVECLQTIENLEKKLDDLKIIKRILMFKAKRVVAESYQDEKMINPEDWDA